MRFKIDQKIFIGSDHGGFDVKRKLKEFVSSRGHETVDCGTDSEVSCDFPDYAQAVAKKVVENPDARGILLCKTGMGMSIAANRFKGVRAGLCYSEEIAKDARYHDDINILCLGSEMNSLEEMQGIISVFLGTSFDAVERRIRRMKKLDGF
jgi:ribose 5-phosphate isomerase B